MSEDNHWKKKRAEIVSGRRRLDPKYPEIEEKRAKEAIVLQNSEELKRKEAQEAAPRAHKIVEVPQGPKKRWSNERRWIAPRPKKEETAANEGGGKKRKKRKIHKKKSYKKKGRKSKNTKRKSKKTKRKSKKTKKGRKKTRRR